MIQLNVLFCRYLFRDSKKVYFECGIYCTPGKTASHCLCQSVLWNKKKSSSALIQNHTLDKKNLLCIHTSVVVHLVLLHAHKKFWTDLEIRIASTPRHKWRIGYIIISLRYHEYQSCFGSAADLEYNVYLNLMKQVSNDNLVKFRGED